MQIQTILDSVTSRVQSTQPTDQGFRLLNVRHRDYSKNFCGYFVPPVLQAQQPPALIESVTGHEHRKAAHLKQYFGEIKNVFFLKNEPLFKDPEDVYSRSARPSASFTYD